MFSFDSMTTTLSAASTSNTNKQSANKVSKEQLAKKAMSNAALAVSSNFNIHNHKQFVNNLRGHIGAAMSNAYLPVPIVLNGQATSVGEF